MESRGGAGLGQIQKTAAALTDSLGTMVAPIANFWGGDAQKRKDMNFSVPRFGFQEQNSKTKDKPWRDFGPGGALGIGCGAGIGVAVTGGAGVGSSPWNSLRLVFGVGIGCGVGLGYGFGTGLGVRWDRRPKKTPASKRLECQPSDTQLTSKPTGENVEAGKKSQKAGEIPLLIEPAQGQRML